MGCVSVWNAVEKSRFYSTQKRVLLRIPRRDTAVSPEWMPALKLRGAAI
jgi:hypothetical protein